MATDVRSDLAFSGGAKITGLPQSAANGQPVVHEQLTAAIQGLAWKDNVRVASTANLNLASPGASIDGVALSSGERVLVKNQTAGAENGIYIWNGAATPMTRATDADSASELLSAVVRVDEGTSNSQTRWRQTIVGITLGTTTITWVSDDTSAPAASETTAGIAELATQAETDAGTDDQRIVTPLKLKTSTFARKAFAATFGDGSATQYDITHNLNTTDVQVSVHVVATGQKLLCDMKAQSANVVRLNFVTAPTSNELRCVVTA